jgi:hypothetical protein
MGFTKEEMTCQSIRSEGKIPKSASMSCLELTDLSIGTTNIIGDDGINENTEDKKHELSGSIELIDDHSSKYSDHRRTFRPKTMDEVNHS